MALAPLSDDVQNMSYTELKARVEVLTRRVNSLTSMKIAVIGSDQTPSITITEANSTLSIPEATDCSAEIAELEAEIVALEAEIVALEAENAELESDLAEACASRLPYFYPYTTSREIDDGSTGSSRQRDVFAPSVTLKLNPYPVDASSDLTWTKTSDENYLNSFTDSYPRINTPYGDGTGQVDIRGRFNGDCFYQLFTNFGRQVGFSNDKNGLGRTATNGVSGATFTDQENGDSYGCYYEPSGQPYQRYATVVMSYTSTSFNDTSPATVSDMPTINVKKASDPFGTNQTSVDLSVTDDYEVVVLELGTYIVIGTFSVTGTDAGGDASVNETSNPCD